MFLSCKTTGNEETLHLLREKKKYKINNQNIINYSIWTWHFLCIEAIALKAFSVSAHHGCRNHLPS